MSTEPKGLRSRSAADALQARCEMETRAREWLDLACSSDDPLQRAEALSHLADEAASEAGSILYDLRFPNVGPLEARFHGDHDLAEES